MQDLEASADYLQAATVEKDEEIGKKEKMILKLRKMIDLYSR